MDLLSQLNESQRAAVAYNEGPQLVIAGAGSGKTRVLTYKIAYLLEQGVPAGNILALTFTNKAAREMKERISKLLSGEYRVQSSEYRVQSSENAAKYLWMGTFHSICARILRQEAGNLGYTRDFSIYDTADSKSVIKQICKEKGLEEKIYKSTVVLSKISAAKNALMSPEDYARHSEIAKRDRFERMYEMPEVYHQYELRLKAANAMDFDDLLVNLCRLLRTDEHALRYYQDIFQYVLVDEYQDTNYAQYLLVKMLAEPQNKVCVVGDDAQSIYSFRGAEIRNILTFQQGYPNAKLFKLERNYRSTQTIVNAANSLIHHNAHQIHKDVYSENAVGDRLKVYAFMTDKDEASGVARMILAESRELRVKSHISYDDIAVLYRTNAQSRVLESELRKNNIPYRIYGGTSFYQRKEIKDAISYFRLAANPADNEALLRVINFPTRGIGDTTMRKVSEQAIIKQMTMLEVVSNPAAAELSVSASTAKRLESFAQMMKRFSELIETKNAYEAAETMLRESGVMTAAALDRTVEGIDRKQNLDELIAGLHEFVEQRENEGVSFTPIQDFLAEVSLLTDQDQNLQDHTERVTLMTVHAAKGLEFACVHIVGLEEDLFPSKFCVSAAEIEEERRLLYVAITRAMEHCTLSFTKQRFTNGTLSFASSSRFLRDIDREYLEVGQFQVSGFKFQDSGSKFQDSGLRKTEAYPVKPAPVPVKQPETRNQKPETPYEAGMRVRHRVFGDGTVNRVYLDEDTGNEKIEIQFDTQGVKTLLLTFAKLERLT